MTHKEEHIEESSETIFEKVGKMAGQAMRRQSDAWMTHFTEHDSSVDGCKWCEENIKVSKLHECSVCGELH